MVVDWFIQISSYIFKSSIEIYIVTVDLFWDINKCIMSLLTKTWPSSLSSMSISLTVYISIQLNKLTYYIPTVVNFLFFILIARRWNLLNLKLLPVRPFIITLFTTSCFKAPLRYSLKKNALINISYPRSLVDYFNQIFKFSRLVVYQRKGTLNFYIFCR